MNQCEQTEAFDRELDSLLDRYAGEFDLTYASLVGVMVIKVIGIALACIEDSDEEE